MPSPRGPEMNDTARHMPRQVTLRIVPDGAGAYAVETIMEVLLERRPLTFAAERVEAALALYRTPAEAIAALSACEAAHIPGDCPLCGAK